MVGVILCKDTHPLAIEMGHKLQFMFGSLSLKTEKFQVKHDVILSLDWIARKGATGTKGACSLYPYDGIFVLRVTEEESTSPQLQEAAAKQQVSDPAVAQDADGAQDAPKAQSDNPAPPCRGRGRGRRAACG
jgi:hypothetical protein